MSLAAWIVLAGLASAGAAPPPTTHYQLRWVRAPGAEACVDSGELADRVGARLGRAAFDGTGATAVVIEAEVRPIAAGWHVAIAMRGPDGEARGARELDQVGADCHVVDEPLALVLALMIDLDAASSSAPPPPVPPPPPPPSPRAARPVPWRAEATFTGAAGLGVLAGASVGARVTVAIDAPQVWPVVVGASWWAPDQRDAGGAQGVALRAWQVGAAVCTPARRLGPIRLTGCGGGELGRLAALGVGFDRNHRVAATLALATLTGRAAIAVGGPAFVVVDLGVEVPLLRPRFVVADGGTMVVHQVAPASMIGALGVGVRF